VSEGIRTPDIQIHSLEATSRNPLPANTSAATAGQLAPQLAPTHADPDLARVVEAWPTLPPAIRRAVLALLGSGD
jgi:hypothetical protein